MRILLTNDDGIDATGLRVLQAVCQSFGEVFVVAPDGERSGVGHATTTSRPLRITPCGPRRFAVDGTPADCVRLGLTQIVPDADWVVSGINRGGNLGVDIHLSGTVAAAREAALFGRRALALSQYMIRERALTEDGMGARAALVLNEVLGQDLAPGMFLNANLPHPEPCDGDVAIVRCPPDPTPLPIAFEARDDAFHFRGTYHDRQRRAEHDVAVCFGGAISLSQLSTGWDPPKAP